MRTSALYFAPLFLLVLQASFPPRAVAQIPSAIPVELLDQNTGLTIGTIDYTYKDSYGYVWIGSRGGLYRFDGKTCRLYMPDSGDSTTIPASWVYTFFIEDEKSDIWFSTPVGITRYIRRSDQFETFPAPGGHNPNQVCFASGLDGQGQLWFTTGEGIFTIHTQTTEIIRRGNFHNMLWVSELQLDAAGKVAYLFAYSRYDHFPGLHIYELEHDTVKRSWSVFVGESGRGMMVSDIEILDSERMLIATTGKCITYNWRTGKSIEHRPPAGTQGNWTASCLASLNDSVVLVGTLNHGYYALNTQTASFTWHKILVHGDDVLADGPHMISKAHDGGVWISLATVGLAYFHPSNIVFDHYPLRSPLDPEPTQLAVQCIAEFDSSTLLIGANGGGYFVHLENDSIASVSHCTQCPPILRSLFRDRRGRIWMSHEGDILVMDRHQRVHWVQRPDSVSFNYDFHELPDGKMLLFTRSGRIFACQEVGGDFVAEPFEIGRPWHRFASAWHTRSGLLYTMNPFRYLLIFDVQKGYRLIDSIPCPLRAQGRAAVSGSDDLFLGTRQGPRYFSRVDREIRELPFINHSGDIVYSVVPYREDEYLLTGTNGIYTVNLRDQSAALYDVSHGIGLMRTNPYAAVAISDGRVCFGNNQGVTFYAPQDQVVPKLPASVHFTEITINGASGAYPTHNGPSGNPDLVHAIDLSHREGTISLAFSSVSYAGLDKCSYEYRLVGLDGDWIQGGTRGYARYINLRPDDYRFDVRIKDRPQSLRSIAISVIPPFYSRIWFIMIIICSILAMTYYAVRLRVQRRQKLLQLEYEKQLAVERERVRISNNLHDDLGSSLSALHLRTEVIAKQSKDADLKSQVDHLTSTTGQLVRQIRETIWTTNAAYDTLDNLISHLHQYAQEFFEGHPVRVSTELPATVDPSSIPGMHRRQIFLAYKEALHNVLKHAQASVVSVVISTSADTLQIKVRDNGRGFDTSAVHSGTGLGSMHLRMERVSGRLEIQSDERGTEVQFVYPF